MNDNREWVLHESTPDPGEPAPSTPLQAYADSIKAVLHSAGEKLSDREVECLFDIVRRVVR